MQNLHNKDGIMRILFFVLSLFISVVWQNDAYATHYNPQRIRRYVEKTPRKVENSLSTLAKHLTRPLDDDYDKAMAIAFWIASHINYDEYLYTKGKTTNLIKGYHGQDADELLKSRVGICGDFAELFVELCKKAGIRAREVHGYAFPAKRYTSSKQRSNTGHAWNYFSYDGKKIYVDTTFMAKGSIESSGRISNYSHRKAIKEVNKDNKYKSQVNDFDEYYFDFNYKKEVRDRHYQHQER